MSRTRCLRRVLWPLWLLACCAADAETPQPSGWHLIASGTPTSRSFTLSLNAQSEVQGWQRTALPVLTLECGQTKAAVFVDTGLPLEVTAFDKQIVRLRLDDHDFVAQRWPEVNNTTVSSRFAAALIRQLAQSRKFVFEFTPFSGAPVRAEFAVEGLSGYLSQLEQACLRN